MASQRKIQDAKKVAKNKLRSSKKFIFELLYFSNYRRIFGLCLHKATHLAPWSPSWFYEIHDLQIEPTIIFKLLQTLSQNENFIKKVHWFDYTKSIFWSSKIFHIATFLHPRFLKFELSSSKNLENDISSKNAGCIKVAKAKLSHQICTFSMKSSLILSLKHLNYIIWFDWRSIPR